MPNSGMDVGKQDNSDIAGGNTKCAHTLKKYLRVSYKTKHALTI